jgi:hypothetical protein
MSVDELKDAVLALETDEKKQLLLQTLPQLSREVMQDREFLMQLLPIFMGLIKDSGIDLGQLAQMAMMMNNNRPPQA